MKTYQVRLNIPTAMWALVEIDADSEEEAAKKALEANAAGTVSYEFAGFDNADAEVLEVEEIETAGVRKGGYDENC